MVFVVVLTIMCYIEHRKDEVVEGGPVTEPFICIILSKIAVVPVLLVRISCHAT